MRAAKFSVFLNEILNLVLDTQNFKPKKIWLLFSAHIPMGGQLNNVTSQRNRQKSNWIERPICFDNKRRINHI